MKLLCVFAALLVSARIFTAASAREDEVTGFYQGKHIDFYISSTPGGGNDASARLIARYLPNHILGHPSVVPRNMPGAGGVTAANYIYNIAPRDGLAMGMIQNSAVFEPLYGNDEARMDIKRANWIGSPNKDVGVLILWHSVPVDSIETAQKRGLVLGVSGGLNAAPAFYARVLSNVFDMKIKMVGGYPGQNEAFLAMERGEIEGYPSAFWSSLKAVKPDWIAHKDIKMLLYFGQSPHPELAGVPFADDLLKNKPASRSLMAVASAPLGVGRPIVAPPVVPPARVEALRKAVADTFRDPDYLAECQKQNLECNDPTSGEDLEKMILDAYSAPPALVQKIRELNTGK